MNQEQETAQNIVRLLDASAASLDADQIARLAEARARAVAKLAAVETVDSGHGTLQLLGAYLLHHRGVSLASLVLVAFFSAFLITEHLRSQHNLEQGDAFLLGAELPPEAYLDKGFDTWLEQTSRR